MNHAIDDLQIVVCQVDLACPDPLVKGPARRPLP